MDCPSDHPLSQLPLTVSQLESATNQLDRIRDQHIVDGRAFSVLSSSYTEFEGIIKKINETAVQFFDQMSDINLSAPTSKETNQLLNHAFRVSRRLNMVVQQINSLEKSAHLDQLIGRIIQIHDRIFSKNFISTPVQSPSQASPLISSSLQPLCSPLPTSPSLQIYNDDDVMQLPIHSQSPSQISPDQKIAAADITSKICASFPEISLDHSHAQSLVETLITNEAEIEVQTHLYVNDPQILQILESLGASIDQCEPIDAAKKRQALTELLVFSTVQIKFDDHGIFRICPAKLAQFLNEAQADTAYIETLIQPPLSIGLSSEATVFQKLLCISHLNFSPEHRMKVRNDPLVQAVLNNPNLKFFLMAGSSLINQCFKESCVGTSYNQLLQSKCGSVAELLYIARESIRVLRYTLEREDLKTELQQPAHDVLIGAAPTKKEYAESVIKRIEQKFSDISKHIFEKIQNSRILISDIKKIIATINYILQDLEAVFDPINPVITSTLPIIENYNLSSIISSAATNIYQLVPNQPTTSSRGKTSYSSEHISKIGQSLFSCRPMIPIGKGEAQFNLNSAINKELPIDSIWNLLFQHGGGVFRLTNRSMEKLFDQMLGGTLGSGCGHAVALFSIYHQGEKAFLRKDPLGEEKIETLKEVKTFIKKFDYLFILIQPISGSTV